MTVRKPKPNWLSFKIVGAGSFGNFYARNSYRGIPLQEIAPGGFRATPSESGLSIKKIKGKKRSKYIARGRAPPDLDFTYRHLYEHAYMSAIKDRLGFPIHAWSALSVFEEAAFPTIFRKTTPKRQGFNQFKKVISWYTPAQIHHMLSYALNYAHSQFRDPRYFNTALLSIHRSAQLRPLLEELNNIQTTPDIGTLSNSADKPRVDAIVIELAQFLVKKAQVYNARTK